MAQRQRAAEVLALLPQAPRVRQISKCELTAHRREEQPVTPWLHGLGAATISAADLLATFLELRLDRAVRAGASLNAVWRGTHSHVGGEGADAIQVPPRFLAQCQALYEDSRDPEQEGWAGRPQLQDAPGRATE